MTAREVATLSIFGDAAREVTLRIEPSPRFMIEGLPEAAAREVSVRVRSALESAGEKAPDVRVVVSEGKARGLDLAIAVAVMAPAMTAKVYAAELGLSGALLPVRGAFVFAEEAVRRDLDLVTAPENGPEAARAAGCRAHVARTLRDVLASDLLPAEARPSQGREPLPDVPGHATAKRAIAIAAVGSHPLLLLGEPGTPKMPLARLLARLQTWGPAEKLAATRAHSLAGLLPPWGHVSEPPFRAPHHTVSEAGMFGTRDRPVGEVQLARGGLLYLDEVVEMRLALAREIATRRAGTAVAGSSCLCPCGFAPGSRCACSRERVLSHRRRFAESGIWRIATRLDLAATGEEAPSAGELAALVQKGENFRAARGPRWSVGYGVGEVLAGEGRHARSTDVLMVARSIADLAESENVEKAHVEEARGLVHEMWGAS